MGTFTQDTSIFKNEHVLRDEYTPERLIERDEEKNDYIQALQPIANGTIPQNVFVYGDTGVGKTVATRILLDELQEDAEEFDNVSVEIAWVNCKDMTSYQVAVELVNALRPPDNQISVTGHSRNKIYDLLWDELDSREATHVVFVLDEVDSLGSDDNLLYQVPRARANNNISNTHVGLVGICNNFRFHEDLSSRVKSTLCQYEIRFGPYDADELRTILSDRAEDAFVDGALSQDAVPLAAAMAGSDTGSARHALDILHKAGSLARRRDAHLVEEEHVREAVEAVEQGVIEDELRDLPTQSHIVLYTIAMLEQMGETPARRPRIYDVYTTICDRIDADKKTQRTVLDRLGQLSLKGFLHVSEVNQGREGGKHHRYGLDVNSEMVHNALRDDARLGEAVQNEPLISGRGSDGHK
jgi:cell division control protein 6